MTATENYEAEKELGRLWKEAGKPEMQVSNHWSVGAWFRMWSHLISKIGMII